MHRAGVFRCDVWRGQAKKLEAAARVWAGGGVTEGPGLIEDLRAFGAPQEVIDVAQQAEQRERLCVVWPENWDTVRLFCDLSTQWQVGFGGVIGLRYESVLAVMRLRRIKGAEMFDDLRVMEAEALRVLSARVRSAR